MSESPREAFLARVRQAVQDGNRAGAIPPLPERGTLGYQGAGTDAVARFAEQLEAAGGRCYLVSDGAAAIARLRELLRSSGAQTLLLGSGDVLDSLRLASLLQADGYAVTRIADVPTRDALFAADVGITGVRHLVAETGSLIVESAPGLSRSESLLPPVHIVIADHSQIVPDLFDVFSAGRAPTSALTIITGPSKTGDIELKLVTGVHGPGEVHVILTTGEPTAP